MTYLNGIGLVRGTESKEHQLYTLRHKVAFVKVQLLLTGEISESGMLHDADKLAMYGLLDSISEAGKIHRKYAEHHIENCKSLYDLQDCIIDYECARFTKPDKPLNAYNTIVTYKSDYLSILKPILQKYGICSPENVDLQLPVLSDTVLNYLFIKNKTAIDKIYTQNKQGKDINKIVMEYYSIK